LISPKHRKIYLAKLHISDEGKRIGTMRYNTPT